MQLLRFILRWILAANSTERDDLSVDLRTQRRQYFWRRNLWPCYSLDERRVARYLVTRAGIGGGDDPVGFLIASHRFIADRLAESTPIDQP